MQQAVKEVAKEALGSQGRATKVDQPLEVATISRIVKPPAGGRQSKQTKTKLSDKQPAGASSASSSHPLSAFASQSAKEPAQPEMAEDEDEAPEPDYDDEPEQPTMADEPEQQSPEPSLNEKKRAAGPASKQAKVAKGTPRVNTKQPASAKHAHRRKRRTVSVCGFV